MNTNTYLALRERHQAEVDALPLHFAFGEAQIREKARKLRLPANPAQWGDRVVVIGGGGFCLRDDYPMVQETFSRHRREIKEAISADKTGEGFILDMFDAELSNHEYGYTGDPSDALRALGLSLRAVEANPALEHGFKKACLHQLGWHEENS